MRTKILITGGLGYTGSVLTNYLSQRYEIYVVDLGIYNL